MRTRAITGFFFISVLIASALLGPYVFITFFGFIATCSVYEFYKMVYVADKREPLLVAGSSVAACSILLGGAIYLNWLPANTITFAILGLLFLYIATLYRRTAHPIQDLVFSLFGLLYVVVPFLFFIALGFVQGDFNGYIPLGFLILLWTNDTGAYLTGRSMGKHKLFERISPNKTWEGFIGGVLLAMVGGGILSHCFEIFPLWCWLSIGFIIGVFGTLGDLVESMLKRNMGVKDSGSLLPGHGGLLDRFDGLLMAAPLVYLFLQFITSFVDSL